MKKTILIIGMGQGLSMGIAEKFGKEGFAIGMISRNADKLAAFQNDLSKLGTESFYAAADVSDTTQMLAAIQHIQEQMGSIHVLQYNAVDFRFQHIMQDTVEDLVSGFKTSVVNALMATKALLPDLKANQGAVLMTGGGSGIYPQPEMGSISLGKAGIRNLSGQLNKVLKADGIFVGTVIVAGSIAPESTTHSPKILADKFWEMYCNKTDAEVIV
jgi:short-subunit dehydrogenase